MNKENLKKELLQKIISCQDEEVLQKLNKILQNLPVVEDPTEVYEFKNYSDATVPDSFYSSLKKEYKDFLNGRLNTKSWQEVRSTIEERNGL